MSKITAQEARELAGLTVQEQVDAVYPLIRQAAENKRRFVFLHGWWSEGYSQSAEYRQACSILEGDGYKVLFCYEQMFTRVEW
jgi:hypothetical protein